MARLTARYDWLLLGDVPDRAERMWGDRTALVFEGQRWTYGEFAADVRAVAKALLARGIGRGDHVAVWMTNRPQWLHLMYAIPKVGATIVPLNTRYRSDDVAYTAAQSQSCLLVLEDQSGPISYRDLFAEARAEIEAAGHLREVVMDGEQLEGTVSYGEFLAAGESVTDEQLAAAAAAVTVDDKMMLAYTSGTTGHPKGVVHTHRPLRNSRERMQLLGHSFDDVHMSYLPLFHLFGFGEVALQAALTGANQVLFNTFDPAEVLDALEVEGGTVLHGFDSHWSDLLREQAARPRDVSSLRVGTLAAGMKSSTPVAEEAQRVFCPTISGWGMSESWAFVSCSHPTNTFEQRTAASGYPMDEMEFEVRDPVSGAVQPVGEQGALFFRGYTVMEGYWDKPDATAAVLDEDGWLDTGDVAYVRPDGHLVFVGRHKDMLKVGGENVSPAEVEGYLLGLGGLEQVAVVGYPDPRLAEVPVAFAVAAGGGDGGGGVSGDGASLDELGEQLIERCKGRIASFKIPRHVLFVDEMPVTPSGKIRKVELRQWALDRLGDPTHG